MLWWECFSKKWFVFSLFSTMKYIYIHMSKSYIYNTFLHGNTLVFLTCFLLCFWMYRMMLVLILWMIRQKKEDIVLLVMLNIRQHQKWVFQKKKWFVSGNIKYLGKSWARKVQRLFTDRFLVLSQEVRPRTNQNTIYLISILGSFTLALKPLGIPPTILGDPWLPETDPRQSPLIPDCPKVLIGNSRLQ